MVTSYGGDVERKYRETGFFGTLLEGFMKIFRREVSPMKRTIESILAEIEAATLSIEEVLGKLKRRYEDLYTSAIKSVTQKNIAKATIYVNELVEIRKIFRRLMISYNFLEQLKIRLQTLNELDKAYPLLLSLSRTIDYLKPQILPIVPGVAVSLEKISSEINSVLGSTSVPSSVVEESYLRLGSREAEELMRKIVEEAEKSVNSKLPELLPELSKLVPPERLEEDVVLPKDILAVNILNPDREKDRTSISKEENISKSRASHTASSQKHDIPKLEDVEKMLLDYITTRGGFLDIKDFSTQYKIPREYVMAALDNLVKKGKVNIVRSGGG
ncbi:MAG: hypothetical protein QXJ51_01410 [Sulfolobales archaeon]